MVPDERFDAYQRQVQVLKLPVFHHFIKLSLTIKAQILSATWSSGRTEVRGWSAEVIGAVS